MDRHHRAARIDRKRACTGNLVLPRSEVHMACRLLIEFLRYEARMKVR